MFVNKNSKKYCAAVLIFIALLLAFGCCGAQNPVLSGLGLVKNSENIVLPHSGEKVTLRIVDQQNDRYWSAFTAVENGTGRTIVYEWSDGKYGGDSSLHYSDTLREYYVNTVRPATMPQRNITYKCVRGDCDEFMDKIRFGDEYSKARSPQEYYLLICFSNSTYIRTYIENGTEEYLFESDAVAVPGTARKDPDLDFTTQEFDAAATISAFNEAQKKYNELNNGSVSIFLGEKDVQELTSGGHGGWTISDYPYLIDSQHYKGHVPVFTVTRRNAEPKTETGTGCS